MNEADRWLWGELRKVHSRRKIREMKEGYYDRKPLKQPRTEYKQHTPFRERNAEQSMRHKYGSHYGLYVYEKSQDTNNPLTYREAAKIAGVSHIALIRMKKRLEKSKND